ncbi:hypothetical protein EGM51_11640 [Verrucomicrobia bacterium S94]|nr:hypothetical protein EGM51_11640 [Verrucomicrobia bacterium S94]
MFRLFGGGAADGDRFHNGSLPWDKAYVTEMTVNGRPAVMRIYSARFSEPVVHQLKSRFEQMGAQVQVQENENGATGRAVFPDQSVGFLVLKPPQQPTQQIFVYEPTGERGTSVKSPVPEYRRAKVRTTISDDKTGTYLATLETTSSATETHVFYAGALQGAGWKMISPALIKNGTVSGMAVYEKKSRVCYVQATDRMDGVNTITILVKGGAL